MVGEIGIGSAVIFLVHGFISNHANFMVMLFCALINPAAFVELINSAG